MGCEWHEGSKAVESDDTPCCPDCLRMLDTRVCETCGEEHLDFSVTGYDDVMAAPRVTADGNVVCVVCLAVSACCEGDDDE